MLKSLKIYNTPLGLVYVCQNENEFALTNKSTVLQPEFNKSVKNQSEHLLTMGSYRKDLIDGYSFLIVGANSYISDRLPQAIMSKYDIFAVMSSLPKNEITISLVVLSKIETNHKSFYITSSGISYSEAINSCLYGVILDHYKHEENLLQTRTTNPRLNRWLNRYLYRLPKLSLRDLLNNNEAKYVENI